MTDTTIEQWRRVWREGFAPLLSTKSLTVLRDALCDDDERLVQGCTTMPPPIPSTKGWPIERACVLGFCGWQGEGLATVEEIHEYFARMCFEADQLLHEPAACRRFLSAWDEMDRDEIRLGLMAEVEMVLEDRKAAMV